MTHDEGASDTLAAIQGRLDRMDIKLDGIHDSLQWQGEMLKFHGYHFSRLEEMLVKHSSVLVEHGNVLKAHDRRFDLVDARFDLVDARFDSVDARFDSVDARFDQVDEMLGKILARLDAPRP